MANLLAKLLVKLGADSTEFQNNMEKASKKTQSFESRARKSMGNVAKAAAAMGAAAAAATAVIVEKNLESIDNLAKTADKLGITTQALAGLRHAAEITGVSQENFDKGLQYMEKNLGDAARGIGLAKQQLEQMNLPVAKLMAMRPEQAFALIADSIDKMGTASQKTSAAAAIFGRQGIDLINTMKLGSKGLKEMTVEAEALGIAVNRVDAAKVEAANDAMTRSKAAIAGMGQTLTIKLAPYIEAVAMALVKASKESGGFKAQISAALKAAITGASYLADIWRGWELVFASLKLAFAGLGMFIMRGLEQWDTAITDTINVAVDSVNTLINGLNKIPKVHIPKLEKAHYSQALAGLRQASEEYYNEVDKAFMKIATKPLPSDKIKDFLAQIDKAAEVAAQKVAAVSSGVQQAALGGQAGSSPQDKAQQKYMAKLEQQLGALEANLRTQEERVNASYQRRTEIINTAYQNGLISKGRQFELLEKAYQDHESRLTAIKLKAETDRERFSNMSWTGQVKNVAGSLQQMTQSVATQSKAMFRINQAASIAMAIVNTAQGVTQALAAYPPPLSFIMAAAVAAAGAVQIATIASANPSGAAGVAPSVATSGATSVTATTPLADNNQNDQTQQQPAQAINIHVYGNIVDQDKFARELVPSLKKALNDGLG